MTFKKSKSAGYLANHMARLFAQKLHARIKPLGLAPAQFMALLELWDSDGLSQKDLVGLLDVEQATMANTLRRMERDGLISRKPSEKDKRSQLVFLSARAKALKTPATEAAKALNQSVLRGIPPEEQQHFLLLMGKTIAALRQE